jgi:hypothetical protein
LRKFLQSLYAKKAASPKYATLPFLRFNFWQNRQKKLF